MMLLALGAEVVLTPKETAVKGAIAKAEEIIAGLDGNGYVSELLIDASLNIGEYLNAVLIYLHHHHQNSLMLSSS